MKMGQRDQSRCGQRRSTGRDRTGVSPVRFEDLEPRLLLAADCPVVTQIAADNRGLVSMTVSRDLNAATVNSSTVRIFTAGADGLLGTADDVAQSATVSYHAATREIRAQATLAANTRYRVQVSGSQVIGTNGVLLDGEFNGAGVNSGDGTPGGDLIFFTRQPLVRIARLTTVSGIIDVELFSDRTPLTVANFLNYANRGDYDTTFFHRSVSGFVVQGGGFRRNPIFQAIPDDPPVLNEPGVSNVRGTIAMAKLPGNPNSATNEFFFNLADNRGTPPNGLDFQNGGFTAFGRITNDAGLAVMDALAAFQRVNAASQGGAFGELPVIDAAAVQMRGGMVVESDLVGITRIALLYDLSAEPAQQLSTAGSVTFTAPAGLGGLATVQLFDIAGTGALGDGSFAQVVFGSNNTISSITLRNPAPAGPIGIRITGATRVGTIADQRTSAGRSIAFIISDARVGTVRISGSVSGFNLNGFALPGGETLDDDIDGDGTRDDRLGILIKEGIVGSLVVTGDLRGDVVARGGLVAVQIGGTAFDADFNLGLGATGFVQTSFQFNLVDGVGISSPVAIGSIRAADWQNNVGGVNTIRATRIGSITTTGDRRTGAPGDFRAGLTLTGVAGMVSLPGAAIAGELGKSAWQITGNVGLVTAGLGFQNWQLRVTGDIAGIRTSDVMEGVTIDVSGRVEVLRAAEFMGGVVRANSAGSILIVGNRRLGRAGDFNAEVTLSRTQAALGPTLGLISVAGSILDSTLNLSGITSSFLVTGRVSNTTVAMAREIGTLRLGEVVNTRFTASNRIGTIVVTRWDGGRVQAPLISELATRGDRGAGLAGDFFADIQANSELTRLNLGSRGSFRGTLTTPRMTTFMVEGDVTGSTINLNRAFSATQVNALNFIVNGRVVDTDIRSRGSIEVMTLGAMERSGVYLGAPTGTFGLPDAPGTITAGAEMRRFTIRGTIGQAGPYMIDSFLVAGRVGFATILLPMRDNSGRPFGVAAGTIGTVQTRFGDGSFRFAGALASRAFGDYQIRVGFAPPATA